MLDYQLYTRGGFGTFAPVPTPLPTNYEVEGFIALQSSIVSTRSVAKTTRGTAPYVFVGSFKQNPCVVPPVIVRTSILSGDPTIPDSDFRMLVEIAQNDSRFTPGGYRFQIDYGTNVTFEAVQNIPGSELNNPTDEPLTTGIQRVLAPGFQLSTAKTPQLFIVDFTVVSAPVFPYSIRVGTEAGFGALIANDLVSTIPVTEYDLTATTDIGAVP